MYIFSTFITALAAASTVQAIQFSDVTTSMSNARRGILSTLLGPIFKKQQGEVCPAVWTEISSTLTQQFLANGECTDAARAAIRAGFHDCFNGACDGSLILANECSRPENAGLERVCENLGTLAGQKQVGVADLIQFAAAHAIKTCPGGPTLRVKVGRPDSDQPSPEGNLPTGHEPASTLVQSFAARGFSAVDLAALIGAHSTARVRSVNRTMDSTPGRWDSKYYSETISGKAPITIEGDGNMAKHSATGIPMKKFAGSKGAWDNAFVPAMEKMGMLGVEARGLVDCTRALPGGSRKRDVKGAGVFERLGW